MTLKPATRRIALLSILACAPLMARCGSSKTGNPAGPSSNSSGSGSSTGSGSGSSAAAICRTYPTAATVTTTLQNGATQNGSLTGAFDSNRATVTTFGPNGGVCTTSVSTYRSTADFVDEVKVIPGLSLQQSTMTTPGPACGGVAASVNYNYDGSGRLTSTVSTALGVSSTTSYTAWDSANRPTAGSFPGGTAISNSYDDGARTWVQRITPPSGAGTTTTMTFDANGNQLRVVSTTGNNTVTTTFSTNATAQVCK